MLGATFLIISDEKIAEELLVKRAKIYSDRPEIRSLFDPKSTYGSMEYLPLMGRNKYWSRQRRFTHAYLTKATNNQYYGVMLFEVKRFLYRLVKNPDDFGFLLEDMASKIMCQLTWDDTSFSADENTINLSGDYEASSVIGMMALVGIFTVAGPLYYFLIAMVLHEDWLVKCQEEIDKNCNGRMPTLDDYPNLPILRACILETLRWKPNVPTGVAHELEVDDFYKGFFIAKGTRILPLDWAFLRNPEKYPDPENYHPERYLEPSWPTYGEPLTVYPTIKGLSSFGYGQRTCLGQSLTQDELLVACGGLCWGFIMRKKIDPVTGREIEIDLQASNSLLIIKPDPFQMEFMPRTDVRKAEMIAQWELAEKKDLEERAAFLSDAVAGE
ncbi:hypothetical protein B7463_g3033, partial [Scytalidium lignicola]